MNVPQLEINYTWPQIDMEWKRGSMEIKQNIPQIDLDYNTSKPYQIMGDMEISAPPAEMDIDYTKPLADLGCRKIRSLINFIDSKSKQKTLKAIQEFAREGDYLGKLELGGNRIAQLARKKMMKEEYTTGIKSLPEHLPEIKVKTHGVKVDVSQTDIKVKTNLVFPKAEIQPDQVKIYLAQKGELDIKVVEHQINMKI